MSLFTNDSPDQGNLLSNPNTPNLDNPFEALVGEGKKYKTQDDLAKSVLHKESHIQRIERENAELREAITKNGRTERLEEMVAQLLEKNKPSNESEPAREPVKDSPPGLTEAELEAKLESLLGKKTQEQTRKANLSQVKQKLVETLGSSYSETLSQKADELGLSAAEVDDLASRNPKLFFKTFDITDKPKQVDTPVPRSSLLSPKSEVFNEGGPKPRSYYLSLKQKDPSRYRSSEIQTAMTKDSMALGEAFFDTND